MRNGRWRNHLRWAIITLPLLSRQRSTTLALAPHGQLSPSTRNLETQVCALPQKPPSEAMSVSPRRHHERLIFPYTATFTAPWWMLGRSYNKTFILRGLCTAAIQFHVRPDGVSRAKWKKTPPRPFPLTRPHLPLSNPKHLKHGPWWLVPAARIKPAVKSPAKMTRLRHV